MVAYFNRICLAAMLVLGGPSFNANAQLSTLPRRYRRAPTARQETRETAAEPSGIERRRVENETKTSIHKRARFLMSDEELSLSMSVSIVTFDLSMSMPSIFESDFGVSSMSLSLESSEFSLSLPMSESIPTDTLSDEVESKTVSVGRSSASSTLILCSFIAGLSALVIGASAMFIRMHRIYARELEQEAPRDLHDIEI